MDPGATDALMKALGDIVQRTRAGVLRTSEIDLAGADPHAPFQEVLDLDSMDFLNLVTFLHDETGIDVPERDYPKLASIDGFVADVASAER